MANFFDQFDAPGGGGGGNFFDQFDEPAPAQAVQNGKTDRQPVAPRQQGFVERWITNPLGRGKNQSLDPAYNVGMFLSGNMSPEDFAQGIVSDYNEAAQYPRDPRDEAAMRAFQKAQDEGWWEATKAVIDNPGIAAQTVMESAPASAAGAGGSVAGGFAGGLAGSAVPVIGTAAGATWGALTGAGLASGYIEFANSLTQALTDTGKPVTRENVLAAIQDPQIMAVARNKALKRGVAVGVFDAISAGVAGKIAKPVEKLAGTGVPGRIAGAGSEVAAQGGLGAAGEASAQLASEGKITSKGDILLEGVGELGTAPIDIGGAVLGREAPPALLPGQQPPAGRQQRIDPTLFPNQPQQGQQGQQLSGPSPPAGPAAGGNFFDQFDEAPPISDDAYLAGAGYTPEQIADMNQSERTAALEEAIAQGVEPADITAGAPAPGTAPRAPAGTRRARQAVQTEQDLEAVRPVVNTEPSEAQKAAGNYQKSHVRIAGLDVSIENPKGSIRSGSDPDTGEAWQSPALPADYGYIKGSRGKDGDQVDVYIGPNPQSDRVFVIDQMDLKTGRFDEHKSILGANEIGEAVDLYVNSFDNPTLDRIGDVTEMSVDEFRQWVKDGKNTKRPAAKAGIGTVTPNTPEPVTSVTPPEVTQGEMVNPEQNLPENSISQPVENVGALIPGISAQEAPPENKGVFPGPSETVPPSHDRALSDYIANTRKPLTPEALAKHAGIDPVEAGRALQKAQGEGRIRVKASGDGYVRNRVFKTPLNLLDRLSVDGIQDPTGELAGMDLPKMGRYGPIIRKNGLHPDEWREILLGEGYIQDPVGDAGGESQITVADIYDLIGRHMGGNPIYSIHDQAEADDIAATRAAELQNPDLEGYDPIVAQYGPEVRADMIVFFAENGGSENDWSVQEIEDAARLMAGGMDADSAFERAAFMAVERDPDDLIIDPAMEAAFRKNNPNVMVALDVPPFPDVETETDAVQQQGSPEEGDGLRTAGADGNAAGSEGDVGAEAAPVRGLGEDGPETGSREPEADEGVTPTAEQGADNLPQTVLPGAEQATLQQVKGAKQSDAARKELEIRQKQSKLRKGGQKGIDEQAGGMFEEKPEGLFDAPQEQAAPRAEAPAAKPKTSEPPAKIEDFGEKILGARKDAVRDIVKSLEDDIDVAVEPLSKSFPQPDYVKLAEAGVDRKTLALIAVMRAQIPTKPKKAYKVKEWAWKVKILRDFAGSLLSNNLTADQVTTKMRAEFATLSGIADTAAIIAELEPRLLPFAAEFRITSSSYSMFNSQKYDPPKKFYTLENADRRRTNVFSDTVDGIKQPAIDHIKAEAEKKLGGAGTKRYTELSIYRDRFTKELFIGFKGVRGTVRLKAGFKDIKEARAYRTDNADALQDQIDKMREGPDLRRAANMPRKGPDRRPGDATPDIFQETFGFRGVQFGNYVEGDRRQSDLNEAFDALMDMADALGIPPKALSLNGRLGLAFGARGHGGRSPAAAHYEPGQIVINLTKHAGPGSLAHEWLHALDHYFARQNGAGEGRAFISEARQRGDVREPVWQAWKAVEKAISKGEFAKRSNDLDEARSKPYYGTTIEKAARAFEKYMVDRLAEKQTNNDYLANIELSSGAYPLDAEMQNDGIRKAFDDLFAAIEVKWSGDRKQAMLYSRGQDSRPSEADAKFAAEVMFNLAENDKLFRYPVSNAQTLESVISSFLPDIQPLGQFMPNDSDKANGVVSKKRFRDEEGNQFFVMEDRDGQVWLDISNYNQGEGGSGVYAAVANYAHNAGKVFIGDPVGLSDIAMRRRTEAMLSSALKFGTTRHIEPHPRQLQGAPELGIPPLKWTYGDDAANVASLIEASTANLLNAAPEIADARYDFSSRTFRTGEGQPLTDGMLQDWRYSSPRIREASAGRTTLKRAILLNTLLRSPGAGRPGLLELVLRQSRELVANGGLKGLLYERQTKTDSGIPASRLNPYRFVASEKQTAKLVADINAIARRILGRNFSRVVLVSDQRAWERQFGANEDAVYDPNTGIIYLALSGSQNPLATLRHEAVHALRQAGVITEQEWAVLSRMAQTRWMEQYDIRERYEDLYRERFDITEAELEELLVEEAVADGLADGWNDAPAEDVIGRIRNRIKMLLDAIRSYLRGEGFTTPDMVIQRIESGKVGQRRAGSGQDRGFDLYERQEGVQQEAPRQASLASRGRTPEPTRAPDDGGRGGFNQAAGVDDDMLEFAGNINLTYIDAADDVQDVLRDAARKADGFIKARRGVVSHDQTKRLAEESGINIKDLLGRKRGEAWNAHEIYAARAMLIKSADIVKQAAARAKNTTSDVDRAYFMRVLTRHAAIQEQIAGMTSEAGRALNQFKMLAGADYIRGVTEMLSEKTHGGKMGPEAVRDLADMVDNLDTPGQVGRMTRDMFRPGFWDMVREYYINSLLSGPTTQTVNFMSNMLVALNQIPESFIAEQIGKFHRGPKMEKGETLARAVGLLEGSREGLSLFWKTLKTGEPHTTETQFEQQTQKAIPGMTGELVRMPSRLMMASDDLFKAVNYRAELNALAVRLATREGLTGRAFAERVAEVRDDPTPQMIRKASDAAKYQTFQNKLGPKGQTLMRFRESWHLWWLLPFLRTPINVIKYATERSPLGPLLMKDARDRLMGKEGATARDVQIARMLLGTIALTGMAAMVLGGMATGGGPDDEKEKAALRGTGWQPYSIKAGDTYYSYLRFDPFSLHLGVLSDMIDMKDLMTKGEYQKVGYLMLSSIVNNIVSKTWLQSATQFSQMTGDPETYMERYAAKIMSGFVPNFFAQIARSQDPELKDARTILDKVKERVPGWRETLPPRIDIFGNKITGEGNLGPDLFSPVYISKQKDNPVANAMIEADYYPGMPRRHMNGHDLTSEQYAVYAEIAGRRAVERLTKVVSAPNWSKRPQEAKEKIIKKAYDDARDFARNSLKRAYPELRQPAAQ